VGFQRQHGLNGFLVQLPGADLALFQQRAQRVIHAHLALVRGQVQDFQIRLVGSLRIPMMSISRSEVMAISA
jgi:hypothetical protein